jgi:hypothetical protein
VTKERDNENDEEVESPRKKVKTSGNLKKKPIQRNPPPPANRVDVSANLCCKNMDLTRCESG